ncbi:hypothetical protein SEE_01087 [Salmonella enterica subsp. enterica serovar Typhimurium str. TN061786]|nr:hypothetical protein SEE_01087 [Salmonella enterica subsp. enterica serovar Typhimurium str. TN061786]
MIQYRNAQTAPLQAAGDSQSHHASANYCYINTLHYLLLETGTIKTVGRIRRSRHPVFLRTRCRMAA